MLIGAGALAGVLFDASTRQFALNQCWELRVDPGGKVTKTKINW
ncbi:hypothetical protein [Calothrix sp. NIES-2100]